ncbi:cadmium resistance transporter [Methanobacterium sp. BAmetb5]|uniref:cadmium resistance transporter n=1 Tax=Methanobacterium sp. BAmetb5 TaxID=2025351 RepID=UPI000E80BC58|nr:cadmium resistance transporter [Methanobacterium sp. BAmetb5]AXV40196.1 MAG: cadmium resistance protein [Methanobacterium sp. BAmetb5]
METVVILTAISAFISTNLDDIFILAAFFSNSEFEAKNIVLGQYLGFIFLLMASSLAYFAQFFIPFQWISLLGFIPLFIGIKGLIKLWKPKNHDISPENTGINSNQHGRKVGAVALITIINGGDNLGVYMPLFASMDAYGLFITAIIFLVLVGFWCILGFKLVNNRLLRDKIRNYGHQILPLVMITIGLLILLRGWL